MKILISIIKSYFIRKRTSNSESTWPCI